MIFATVLNAGHLNKLLADEIAPFIYALLTDLKMLQFYKENGDIHWRSRGGGGGGGDSHI